jgi:sugar lactone lactonase YvrE
MHILEPTSPALRLRTRLPSVGASSLMVGAIALALAACGSSAGGTIPCDAETACPNPLQCNVEEGVCVDPADDRPYNCSPPIPGCACEPGDEPVGCLLPQQGTDLVGTCREGRSLCDNGVYQPCELVANPYCSEIGVGAGSFDVRPDNSSQVDLGPEGELVLVPDVKRVDFGFLWVANTGENTVSKIDIETGREVARYAAVRDSAGLGVPAVPSPGGFNGDQQRCGNCPSRTAIDYNGDAFVANRAFGEQGTVTKYANRFEDCVDRNGNGVIDTSVDLNNDGVIDVNDPGEFLGEDDECILWTAPVGDRSGVPRALAIDAGGPDGESGNVWVGLYSERRVIQISGDTGAPVTIGGSPVSVEMSQTQPYGAAVDGGGNLWVTGLIDGNTTYLARVNTFTATLTQMYGIPDDSSGCSESYGISIDTKQRIWLGGWRCRDVKVFDPSTEQWYRRNINDESNTRGVAVDTSGNVWVAFTGGKVGKLKAEDVVNMGQSAPVQIFDLPTLPGEPDPDSTIGVGIDRNGACWVVSRNDDSSFGSATRIDVNDNVDAFPVGRNPYTYSDFTGFGLATVVRPNGYWRGVLEGCATSDAITEWTVLNWSANEPPGTSVRMRVRVADTVPELAAATWYGPWDEPPVDLAAAGVPDGKVMQVEVQLSTEDPGVTPTFTGFTVSFNCPGVPPIL